jgi:hypothetical protein
LRPCRRQYSIRRCSGSPACSLQNAHFLRRLTAKVKRRGRQISFDSRWVTPVGGAPSRHISTRGAADGAHDQHLTRGWGVEWISGSVVEGAPTEEPRPDASNARSQRPAPRAIGVSRAFACVLNTRGCPQVLYTAPVPVIHPVRVHKYPWQAS